MPQENLKLMETYSKEIEERRKNFEKYTEVIYSRVNKLNGYEYILVGFEKIIHSRKDISKNVRNIRERAENINKILVSANNIISKSHSKKLDKQKLLKNSYKSTYVVLFTQDWLLIVNEPQKKFTDTKFDCFSFTGLTDLP